MLNMEEKLHFKSIEPHKLSTVSVKSDTQLSIPRAHGIGVNVNVNSQIRSNHGERKRSYTKVNRCRCDCCTFWRTHLKKVLNRTYEFIYRNQIDHYLTRNEFYLDDDIFNRHEKRNVSDTTVMLDYSELTVTFQEDFKKLYLHKRVKQCLTEMKINSLQKIQYYVWPTLLRNQNVVLVGDPNSGKSFSYIPPIVAVICEEIEFYGVDNNSTSDQRIQPWVIIICSNSREVFQIFKHFSTFQVANLRFSYILSPLLVHDFTKCINQHPQLIIGTPEAFLEALEMHYIDFQTLIVCVFETWNSFSRNQIQICNEIVRNFENQLIKVDKEHPLLVAVSELWTLDLKSFADEHFNDPVYCIQSNIEASLYAGHKFRFVIIEDKEKLRFVYDIIKQIDGNERILVISNSDFELLKLSEFLINFGIMFDWLSKRMSKEEIRAINSDWNSTGYSKSVLLCTDEVFCLTHIQNATVLINLSMPDLWSTFQFRFSALIDNTTIIKLKSIRKCQIHIIIDKESSHLMYPLSNLLRRLDFDDEGYREFCDNYCETVEKLKANSGYQLCSTLLSYGQCFDQTYHNTCKRSHRFLQNDNILDLPNCGILKFRILKVRSPIHFFVKLFETIDADSTIDQVQQCLDDFKYQFNNDGSSIRYVDIHDEISIGQLYGYAMHNDKMVARAKILAIGYRLVDIFLIDTGHELYNVPIDDLFHLPEPLKQLPSSTVEVHLANLVPNHLQTEKSYCLHCTHTVIRKLGKQSSSKHYHCGRILFRYQSIYWLEDVHVCENQGRKMLSLKDYLLENQIAITDNSILDTLKKSIKSVQEDFVDLLDNLDIGDISESSLSNSIDKK